MSNSPQQPMRFREKIVNLSQIDFSDDAFRITTEKQVDDLMRSINHVGIMHLPLLLKKETTYTIVCGFRRIEACRRLNWFKLEAMILEADTMRLKCIKYAITDNAFQRPLNLIEKSRSIEMLFDFFKDINRLSEELSVLGLSEHPSMIKKLKGICHLPKPLQNSILSNTISLSMLLELAGMSWDDAKDFITLFNTLKLSLNKQREIVTMVKEIAIREDKSILQVIEESHLKKILMNEDLDKNQKAHNIRIYLKQRRFPSIAVIEKSYEKYRQKLNLKSGFKLIPPINFESSTYTLQLSFNNMTQLKGLKTAFDAIMENPSLKKIVD
ncbi:MAG: ParB/RepB/Spo0J family partition protein [Desulfobacterales bacterium]|nr:ParB/RepB/Spo0J family partition protein [Desulfobacterales bacterium]